MTESESVPSRNARLELIVRKTATALFALHLLNNQQCQVQTQAISKAIGKANMQKAECVSNANFVAVAATAGGRRTQSKSTPPSNL
jgi:xanthine dehydrogenase molybdopterin-binding subunit B